ncbi:MAG: transporter substrate-binding domain-containing protein, partial [Anaerolineae bacterium]
MVESPGDPPAVGLPVATSLYADRSVRIGIYENEPLVFTDSQGQPRGLYVDLLEHVARQEGWRLEYVWCEWPDCLARLERGDLDLMTAIAHSPEREARFDFTRETVLANWGQVYAHPGVKVESVLDLDDRRLAAVPEDIYTRGLMDTLARFGVRPEVLPAVDYGEVFRLVEGGQAEAGIVARLYGGQHEAKYDVRLTPILCCPVELRFAAPKGRSRDLLETLDRHLAALKAERRSVYYQSLDRWLLAGRAR